MQRYGISTALEPLWKDESQETLTGLIRARGGRGHRCHSPPWPPRGTRGGSYRRRYGRLQLREGRARARRGRDAVAGGNRGRRRGEKVGHRILRRPAEWNSGQLVSRPGRPCSDSKDDSPTVLLLFCPMPSWSREPAPVFFPPCCCPFSVNSMNVYSLGSEKPNIFKFD